MNRRINTRSTRSPIPVIIGAGITEQYYFSHIKSIYGFQFKIRPRYFGTESLFEIEKKIERVIEEGRIAICVFDADVAYRNEKEKKKLVALFKKYSKSKRVVFCDSLPSIEYWFLLHYKNTNRHFNDSSDILRELKKEIPDFEKTMNFLEKEKWVSDMCSNNKLSIAKQRAKSFEHTATSYSNIYKAFDLLENGD